jgi:lysozyme family protein
MLTVAKLPPLSAIPDALKPTLAEILGREGTRFEIDPDDPGGATRCGIDLRSARAARLDLNGDGRTDLNDIRDVTPDLADRLILLNYCLTPGVDKLPAPVQPVILDTTFNCGVEGATQVLHAARGELSVPALARVPLSGCAGLLTAAIQAHGAATTIDTIVRARVTHYRRIATRRPASSKYLNGWVLRALHYASHGMRLRYATLLGSHGETP